MELSKLNLKDISIHFSIYDFENCIEPMNLLTQFLSDNKVIIDKDTNIHLGHKKDLTDNDSLFYQLKRIFPNNIIYWWNLMGHDYVVHFLFFQMLKIKNQQLLKQILKIFLWNLKCVKN